MEKSIIRKIVTTTNDKYCATRIYIFGVLVYIKKHVDAGEYREYMKHIA